MGAGGGMLWLGRWVVGSVVGRLGRKPRFSLVFLSFGEVRPIGNLPLLCSGLPASGLVFFKVLGKNVIFVEARAQFSIWAWRRLPKSLFTTKTSDN